MPSMEDMAETFPLLSREYLFIFGLISMLSSFISSFCVCVCVTSFPFPAKSNQKFTLSVHSLKIELLSKLADENKTTTTTTEEDCVVIFLKEKNQQ